MKKIILTALLALVSLLQLPAATIKVQAPNLVGPDEQFNLTFIIEGEHAPSSFEWNCPDEDFRIVWGPQKGTSTSISIVNGKKSTSSQTTYTYVLLPKRSGTFTIPSATATIKGENVSSRAVSIEVVGGNASSGQQAHSSSSSHPSSPSSSATQSDRSSDLYMRLILSKNRAVVGETVAATLKLYQRVTIAGFEDAHFPNFNGFWSQELQAPSNIEFRRENVGGEIFNTAVLRSWNLIPQQAGEIRIEPAELVCLVNVRAPRASTGSIFDSFFQDDYQTVRKRISTPAQTVTVSALPAGAPASFSGGVGRFTMNASVSRDSLRAHDAASLKVTVAGKGNIALLEAPKLKFPPDFEVYDTKVTDGASGKVFEYPFIPRSHGEFDLGPVEFSYYDVSEGRYVTLKSAPLHISVSRGAEDISYGTQTVAAPVSQKDIRNLGEDIHYIAVREPSLSRRRSPWVGTPLFWVIAALMVVAAAASCIFGIKFRERRSDVIRTKGRAALKMARKRLSKAGEYLSGDLYSAFYEELHRALLCYVGDKFNMDISDMSRENIANRLVSEGAGEDAAREFTGLLEACEFARYSPSAGHEAMSAHYEQAVSAIAAIEEGMKHTKKGSVTAAAAALAILAGVSGFAPDLRASAPADSLWAAGVSAYENGLWDEAGRNFEAIRDMGLESAELHYNIGCAAFKRQEYAKAILGFERALKLDPAYPDAKFNLEFANSRIQDKVEVVPEFFLKTFFRNAGRMLTSNAWAVLFLVFLGAALGMVVLFVLGTGRARKAGFFSALASLLLALIVLSFSISGKKAFESDEEAIVVSAVSSVKSAPGDSSTDLFVLHEGTKVKVSDSVRGWLEIELSDGREGWLKESEIERI